MFKFFHLRLLLPAVFCVMFLVVSCSDNPSSINDKPPTLPPVSSMSMDFSSIENHQDTNTSKAQSVQNFSRATKTELVMKTVVELNLATPKALLTTANSIDAKLNKNDQWQWKYSESVDGNSYSVRLVASREDGDTINWNFYVANSGLGLDDQLLFSGTTNAKATEGTWSYYRLKNGGSKEKLSELKWKIIGKKDVRLRLEITSDRNDKKEDYINYTIDGDVKTAVYYDSSADETTEIQINMETHVGYFISPDYNNGQQACWDENFRDIACGEL